MLVAIISDIHDNIPNLEKCLIWCRRNNIEKIICCGDLTTLETLSYLAQNFPGEIFLVNGNCEIYEEKESGKFSRVTHRGAIGLEEIDDRLIGFCHEPEKIKMIERRSPRQPDFIFYGHTHQPWIEKKGTTIIANPGTVAGTFSQATFAVLDSQMNKLDLKIIADLKD